MRKTWEPTYDHLPLEEREICMGIRGNISLMSLEEIGLTYLAGLHALRDYQQVGSLERRNLSSAISIMLEHGMRCRSNVEMTQPLDKEKLLTLAGQLYRHSIQNQHSDIAKAQFKNIGRLLMLFVRSRYTLTSQSAPRRLS